MPSPSRYAVTVMCEDQVGLVARITTAVFERDGNVEQLYQGVLQGYFVITALVTYPDAITEEEVRKELAAVSGGTRMEVSVLPRKESVPAAGSGAPFVLTLTGRDRTGILKKTTAFLADRGVNIEDLSSRVDSGDFAIIAHLTVPELQPVHALRLDLAEIHAESGIRVTLMHEDIFRATSRIDMRSLRREPHV